MRASLVLIRAAVCWIALGLSLGCTNKKRTAEQASENATSFLAELPVPPELVAELSVAHPDATFRAVRELGSPMSALLPVGFPMFAATALGLPPLSADSFDPDIAAVGTLAQNSKGELGWVVALHALSGPELVAKLSTGNHAPFRALAGERKGLTLLQPSPVPGSPAGKPPPVLGVFDNYLLAAADAELLASVGPYTARNLPRRSPRAAGLTIRVLQHALASAVVPALRAFWASYRTGLARQDQADRAAHGGRAPDFADPAQVILAMDAGFESMLAVLEGATALELDVDPSPDRLELTALLTPAAGSPAQRQLAALTAGDAQGLLELPAETRLAVGFSRSASDREEAAKVAGEDWVRLLGPRLSERDAKTLRGAFADWELGRGTHTSFGLLGGSEPGGFVVTDVANDARLKRAGHGLLGLLSLPSVRAPLAEFLGLPRVTESVAADAELATDVQLAKIAFTPSGPVGHPKTAQVPPLACAWFVTQQRGFAALGKDSDPLLRKVALAARSRQAALGASAVVVEAVQRIGDQAAIFAYADARAGALAAPNGAASAPPAPVLLSAGRRGESGFMRIEVSKPAVDSALSQLVGL